VAPSITSQPQEQSITTGQSAVLTVRVAGSDPIHYQWYMGASGATSAPVAGATASDFMTPALMSTSTFWVRAENAAGSVDSAAATVSVSSPPSPPVTPSAPPPAPAPSGSSSLEEVVVQLINQKRGSGVSCGGTFYPPVVSLTVDPHLATSARGHSQDMAANNYFSHTSLDGRTFDQRIFQAGYNGGYPIGENIAAGQSSAQAVVDAWMQSLGHCQNIMNGAFRVIGIGYASSSSSTYRDYWTGDFGGG